MAGRPNKQGLDYFPVDVDVLTDPKIKWLTIRFGFKGEGVFFRLLCEIYRNGYFMQFDEETAQVIAFSVGDKGQHCCVMDVVYELLKRGFFDESIFKRFAILTSAGIQKRYSQAVAERKQVDINHDIWLIDLPKNAKSSTNPINPPINPINPPDIPQSKVKESKVKENKQIKALFDDAWREYPNKQGKFDAFKAFEKAIKDGVSFDLILEGVRKYALFVKQSRVEPQFIKHGSTWFTGQCWGDEYATSKAAVKPKPNAFNNYKQRENDYSKYEELERAHLREKHQNLKPFGTRPALRGVLA